MNYALVTIWVPLRRSAAQVSRKQERVTWRSRVTGVLKRQRHEDWACLIVLISLGLFLLFSERFWVLLPF
jgi:hypothetical protein